MAAVNGLVAWLLEQIDHDERVANLSGRGNAEWSEERRRIVAQCQAWLEGDRAHPAQVMLKTLALPYAERPGYREEWRP